MPREIELWDLMPDDTHEDGPARIMAVGYNAREMIERGQGRYVRELPPGVVPGAAEARRLAAENAEAALAESNRQKEIARDAEARRRRANQTWPAKPPQKLHAYQINAAKGA